LKIARELWKVKGMLGDLAFCFCFKLRLLQPLLFPINL
jgi:hypothetical protein